MAYTSISELPTQVRNSLSEEDQAFWKDAYNSQNPQNDEDARKARMHAWMMCKDRPSSFSFSAVASVEDWDVDNEIISVDDLIKSMDRYIDSGGAMSWNHNNYSVGCCWGYEPFTKDGMKGLKIWGNIFGGDDGVYDEVRKRFVKGASSVSVAGESNGSHYECNSKGCGFKRGVSELMEIAITPRPANRHAVTLSYNEKAAKNFAKSADGAVKFTFSEISIHKDESTCPILKLRKALRECGIDAHARENGVFVPFTKSPGELREIGLNATYTDGGMLLKEDDTLKALFQEGFEKGLVSPEGVLSELDFQFFAKACDMGLVEHRNGVYRLIDPFESFQKVAAWKQFGEEGQKAVDESGQHARGLHLNDITDNGGMKREAFDPEKFKLVYTPKDVTNEPMAKKPEGGYYESTYMPNKPDMRHSDAEAAYLSPEERKDGFVTSLYPDAKVLHIRNSSDWDKLFDDFEPSYTGYISYPYVEDDPDMYRGSKGRYIPFQNLLRDYDAIQFDTMPNYEHARHNNWNVERSHSEKGLDSGWDEWKGRTDEKTLYPYRGRSNYRLVLNPYAVMSSSPYSSTNAEGEARSSDWAPFDREASLEKLRARYEKEGIPINWDRPIAKAAKWKEVEGAEDAVKQQRLDSPDEDQPYEWLHTGIHSGSDQDFDPEKFTPIKNFRRQVRGDDMNSMREGGDPDDPTSYYSMVQEGLPDGGLYASHRAGSGDSSHWASAYERRHEDSILVPHGWYNKNGFSFDLKPEANIFNVDTLDDYAKLLRENPVWTRNNTAVGVNWEGLKGKGIQGVYFSPKFSDVIREHSKWDDETKGKGWVMEGGDWGPRERDLVLTPEGTLDDIYGRFKDNPPMLRSNPNYEEAEKLRKRKGRVLGLDYDGADHLIITDPDAILRHKPYIHPKSVQKSEEPHENRSEDNN